MSAVLLLLALAGFAQQRAPAPVMLSVPRAVKGPVEVAIVCRDTRRMWTAPGPWRLLNVDAAIVRPLPGCRVLLRPVGAATYLASVDVTGQEGARPLAFASEWLRTVRAPWAPSLPYWVGPSVREVACVRASAESLCLFVPAFDSGALVALDESGLRFALSPAHAGSGAVGWQNAPWGRLIRLSAPVASRLSVRVTVLESALKHGRDLLKEARASSAATVYRLADDMFWIAGGPPERGARLEVAGPLAAVTRLDLGHVRGSPLTTLEVTLAPEAFIEGDVRSRGVLLAGATVTVMRLIARPGASDSDEATWPMERVGASTTDASGRFEFRGLSPEKHELIVSHPKRGRTRLIVSAPSVQRVTLTPRAVVRGRIVRSGAPASGAVVTVLPSYDAVTAARNPLTLFAESAETGLDGRFEILLPDEGRIALTAVYGDAVSRVDLGEAAGLQPVVDVGDVPMEDAHDVAILLDLPAGCVVAAAGPVGQAGMLLRRAEADGPGRWRLKSPLAGRWLVEATCGASDVPLDPAIIDIAGRKAELFRLAVRR